MRRGDRAGRAGVDAARAGSATGDLRRVGRQLERGENFREKKPGPQLAVEQHRALAVPADPGLGGKVALQHGPGIDIDFLPSAGRGEKLVQLAQFPLDHLVIIVAPGITRDAPGAVVSLRGGSPCQ